MDASTSQRGQARPEESGIDFDSFYVDEAWQVWTAFGLTSPYDARAMRGVVFDDHEAVDALAGTRSHTNADGKGRADGAMLPDQSRTKPWWRFW